MYVLNDNGKPLPDFMTVSSTNITFYTVNIKDLGIHKLLIILDDKYSPPNLYRMKITLSDPLKEVGGNGQNLSATNFEIIKSDFRIMKITKDGYLKIKIKSVRETEQITKLLRVSDLELTIFNEDMQEQILANITSKDISANLITLQINYKNPS